MFDKKDLKALEKIGCQTLLDLALQIPKSYENYFLAQKPQSGEMQLLDVEVMAITKRPKYLQLLLFCHNFNRSMRGIIFYFKPFHFISFKEGNRLFVYGKIERQEQLQIVQPKIIAPSGVDTVCVKYRSKSIHKHIDKYLHIEALHDCGLNYTIAELIIDIHYPDEAFVKAYKSEKGFSKKHLYALKFVELFTYLDKLHKKNSRHPSLYQFDNAQKDMAQWTKTLPFTLTKDQQKALKDIAKDLASKDASRRIIVGDVGSGKSIIALGASMMVYPRRSILMAPTTLLAHQLYQEAKKFLPSSMEIALLTQKDKIKNEKPIKRADKTLSSEGQSAEDHEKELASLSAIKDSANLIIGTHALLYHPIDDVALVMVDEQHRFGSNQRHLIETLSKQEDKRAHFLQFSATPIPRTMAMIESALVDFSFLTTTPFKKNITTELIGKKDFKSLLTHIKAEIAKGHQTIIVYPLVEESDAMNYRSIEEAKAFWQKNFDKVFITFGKDKDKDKVLEAFKNEGDILLATTVIEVGISLDRLSTIVIVGAERLGLATLHQLRGRVSRRGIDGFCFLYTNDENNERLKEFSGINNGFDIAHLDLKYRQSGDLLNGKRQSGKLFEFIDLANDDEIIKTVSGFFENKQQKDYNIRN